jgi:hypothetical protein
MQNGIFTILYYRNSRGGVAFSPDEGETVVVPKGRRIPITSVWQEIDDEDEEDILPGLTPIQVQILEEAKQRPPMTELEQMAWELGRRERLAERDYAPPENEFRRILESAIVVVSDFED